jgi:hypothetical protein
MPALSASAQYVAVATASAKFTNPMSPGILYRFTANTDCWVKVTVTGGSAAASTADNHLCLSGQTLILAAPAGDINTTANSFVHVIRNTADGKATLSPIGYGTNA